MSREAGGTLSMVLGTLLLRLAITGEHQRYVRAGMAPWLIVAGIVLIVLGGVSVARALRATGEHDERDEHDGHGHGAGERVGWLLLGPVVALLLIAPPALGSFAVDRSSRVEVSRGGATFEPLPANGVQPLTVFELMQRAADQDGASLRGATVELTGFVAGQRDSSGFRMARYSIACCAADALAAVARVEGVTGEAPPSDTWVRVTGTYGGIADDVPVLLATTVQPIPAPTDPYEG